MKPHELRPAPGAHKRGKRVGRGNGSGRGTYSGRGIKGQKARSGGNIPPFFEGGQLKLVKRLSEARGFVNIFKTRWAEVNVAQLNVFPPGSTVGPEELWRAGLVEKREAPVAVLGEGKLLPPLTVRAHRFTKSAQEKIAAAGGTAEVLAMGPKRHRSRSPRSRPA
jgi:large subunit ribosomal protein L15